MDPNCSLLLTCLALTCLLLYYLPAFTQKHTYSTLYACDSFLDKHMNSRTGILCLHLELSGRLVTSDDLKGNR